MTLFSMPALAGKYSNAVAAAGSLQGRVLWCDAEANLFALDSREKVVGLVQNCRDARITTLVVDVKPLCGLVLYNSKIAPKLREWKGKPYPADYDLLTTMVEEGKKAGIEVYAAINVFSEGQLDVPGGPAYAHPDWQCVKYEVDRWAHGVTADTYPIDGANTKAKPGKIILVTKPDSLPKVTPYDALAVAVDSTNKVTAVAEGIAASGITLPQGGYALIASGPAGDWLRKNAGVGSPMTVEGKPLFIPVGRSADMHLAVFVNPTNPEVRDYEMSIVREIISNYDVAGIVFDRMRYPGMYADFGELTRAKFEAWAGEKIERFPEDVMTLSPMPDGSFTQGKHFPKWMEFRAKQIHDFVDDARKLVRTVKPDAKVAAYVGSWYNSYFDVGVNWASPSHKPPYRWALPSYQSTGYADLMDWLCTGCYYEYATREEAQAAGASEGASVEAAGQESSQVISDDTWVYASLYVLQYKGQPEAFKRAIEACNSSTQGVMLFDLCYIRDYNWWDLLKQTFGDTTKAPHQIPGLSGKVKDIKHTIEESCRL